MPPRCFLLRPIQSFNIRTGQEGINANKPTVLTLHPAVNRRIARVLSCHAVVSLPTLAALEPDAKLCPRSLPPGKLAEARGEGPMFGSAQS